MEFKGIKEKLNISGITEGTTQCMPNTILHNKLGMFYKVFGRTKEECEANAKLVQNSFDLLEALGHTLEVLYKCDCPPELMETYGNLFMNYNNLIHEIKS